MKPEQMTAWSLDELSDEERAQMESLLKEDAEIQGQAAKTKSFCDFLTTELRDDSLAFTQEQREELQRTSPGKASSSPCHKEALRPKPASFWQRHAVIQLSAAAAVVMGTTLLIRHQMETENVAADAETSMMRFESENEGKEKTVNRAVAMFDDVRPMAPASPVPEPANSLQKDGRSEALRTPDANMAFEKTLRSDPVNNAARNGMERSEQERAKNQEFTGDPQRARKLNMINEGPQSLSGTVGSQILAESSTASAPKPAPSPPAVVLSGSATVPMVAAAAPLAPGKPLDDFSNLSVPAARSNDMGDTRASTTQAQAGKKQEDLALDQSSMVGGFMDRRADAFGNESYNQIIENKLLDVSREPLSTFSIDVDAASYANVRRFLNQNSAPPRDAVRLEELINYFPTDEEGPAPAAKEPFAVKVEMAACPWQPQHRLARIAIKGRQVGQDRQPGNLVFLVDVSGAMGQPNKLPLVQQSLRMLATQLGENDRVSMVTYAGGTQVVLASTSGEKKGDILAAIDRLQAGGGTHGSAGIRLAYEQAVNGFIKGGVNRVILCTDGDFNVGISSPEELETYITEQARSGVFLSVLGYGSGNLKDRTMETLADKGNGNYAYIDSLSEARKVLVEQMNGTLVTIAKDVKIQVEFNPSVIRSYRLIGYENRLLAKEDFNDDTKDAGEIGAGHSVTALYELVPANLPPGSEPSPLVDDLKYQKPAATSAPASVPVADAAPADEALTVKLRYKEPEASTSQLIEVPVRDSSRAIQEAGSEFKFSAAVAGFGLLLRHSSYAGDLTWDAVRKLAQEGKGTDALGYRGEFLQLIEKARGMSGEP